LQKRLLRSEIVRKRSLHRGYQTLEIKDREACLLGDIGGMKSEEVYCREGILLNGWDKSGEGAQGKRREDLEEVCHENDG
jgi:hypothetical protein